MVGRDDLFGKGISLNKAGSFTKNHDEQLTCDKPATSNNSDGFSR